MLNLFCPTKHCNGRLDEEYGIVNYLPDRTSIEMTGQCSNSAAIAKCTAALCALHGGHDHAVVAQPFRNLCTSLHQRQDGYVLRFEEELRLARNLAFLAYAKDDSNCIPAVCIEQDKTRGALNVRVATNTGELLLKNAVNGLQQVFDLMTSAESL